MTAAEIPHELHLFIGRHTPSMDHVALLVTLRDGAPAAMAAADLARAVSLDPAVVERALRDLERSALVTRRGDQLQYAADADTRLLVEQLSHMYHTKPVTLVRAIYSRPARAVQRFADAFRIRGGDA